MTDHTLMGTTDAMVWAEEFCRIFNGEVVGGDGTGEAVVDEGLMVGWFANAMALAEREAAQKFCPHTMVNRIELADSLASCSRCGKVWSESA